MKKQVETTGFEQNVYTRPDFINALASRGEMGRSCALLAESLKKLKGTEVIKFEVQEFQEKFKSKGSIKTVIQYVKTNLRQRHKIPNPRVELLDGKIFCWI